MSVRRTFSVLLAVFRSLDGEGRRRARRKVGIGILSDLIRFLMLGGGIGRVWREVGTVRGTAIARFLRMERSVGGE